MKSIQQLINEQKENNEETEFYPTTQNMVNKIAIKLEQEFHSYKACRRILDIGCGNGCFFSKLEKTKFGETYIDKFGIEKSAILLNELPSNIVLLGTDFNEQTLLDKEMDLIFCNPPYSVYEEWATRIIKEGNAEAIVLIIPERWKNSDKIKQALKDRHLKADCIGTDDFLDAERKARAQVEILYIKQDNNKSCVDPFNYWFDNSFKISANKVEESSYQFEESKSNSLDNELVQTENIAEQLVTFYQRDMEHLFDNYKALESLDYDILKVLNIDIHNLKKSLKEKIMGLKHIYWNKLFENYNEITRRLTSFSRDNFLKQLHKNAEIDFTMNNIYAVTMWIIKNSNTMYDEQLKNYYLSLADKDSIQMYKSNKRFTDDEWKYIKEKSDRAWYFYKNENEESLKYFCYDYRIIYKKSWNNQDYDYNRFSDSAFNFIWDTIHIAENLGFKFKNVFNERRWNAGFFKELNLQYEDGSPFANMKFYGNGNIHVKFDIKFMQKLNVEASRLFGWITSKEEASEELGMTLQDASVAWNSNVKILAQSTINMIEWKK